MWTAKEVAHIGETLNKFDVEDILTSEELEAIPPNALKNIRSTVIEPKHKHKVNYILNYHGTISMFNPGTIFKLYFIFVDETNYISKYCEEFGCL